jgi:hypothetical protein
MLFPWKDAKIYNKENSVSLGSLDCGAYMASA